MSDPDDVDPGARPWTRGACAAIVAGLVGIALAVRSVGVHDAVIRDDGVRLQGADAWHHLRQVDQLVRHFPERMRFDPYALFPAGQDVGVAPLFDVLAAVVALVVGGLSPSDRTVALVTAWMPGVLGALTCVPAYLLAREIAGRAAGLLAAATVAALSGQLLGRTMLGFADHHALEAVLAPLTVLALARATSQPERRRALHAAALAGAVLVLYLLSWTGGALLVLVLAVWAVVQINVDHARGAGGGRTGAVAAAFFGVALALQSVLGWDLPGARYQRLALVGAVAAAAGLGVLGRWLARGGRSRVHLPMATLAVAAGAAAALAAVSPATLREGWRALTWFAASGLQETVGEAAPLLRPQGSFSLSMAWGHYGTALPLALVGLVVLGRRVVREGRSADTLVAAWSLAMLLATLGQNRFGYYFAVCAAVLCGVLLGPPLARLWTDADSDVPLWIRRGLWPAAALVGVILPVAPLAARTAQTYRGPRDAWMDALVFLRESTPEPFGDPAAFDRVFPRAEAPRPQSGVLAWWDPGYWITTIARRVPASNPTQAGAREVAELLMQRDPWEAARRCRESGLRHVVLDGQIPFLPTGPGRISGLLGQVARWADVPSDTLYRTYQVREKDGAWQPLVLFEPGYFETLAVRLHVFEGKRVVPFESSQLVWYEEEPDGAGGTRLVVTELRSYETYERAARRLERALEAGERVRLVSDSPLFSCIPLEPVDGAFLRVFASRQAAISRLTRAVPDVQVWEVVD